MHSCLFCVWLCVLDVKLLLNAGRCLEIGVLLCLAAVVQQCEAPVTIVWKVCVAVLFLGLLLWCAVVCCNSLMLCFLVVLCVSFVCCCVTSSSFLCLFSSSASRGETLRWASSSCFLCRISCSLFLDSRTLCSSGFVSTLVPLLHKHTHCVY